uniref:Separase n=1 Tax=Rhodnius prolixus TaxID=13249 RepID=T1I4G7_RHOPR
MALNTIIKLILEDNVNCAYLKAEGTIQKLSVKDVDEILTALYKLVYKSRLRGKRCKSDTIDIYKLTSLCCSKISLTWKCKRLTFMQCLYHIKSYLLQQSEPILARTLCNYYFKLKDETDISKWDESEELVLSNTIYNFVTYIKDNSRQLIKDIAISSDSSLTSWISFILKLAKLNNFNKLSSCFGIISIVLPIISKSQLQRNYVDFGMDCIDLIISFFDNILVDTQDKILCAKNLIAFLHLLDNFIYNINEETIKANGPKFMKVITLAEELVNNEDGIVLRFLKNCFFICLNADHSDISVQFQNFYSILSKKIDSTEARMLTSSMLFKFRTIVFNNKTIEKSLLLSFCKELYSQTRKDSLTPRIVYEIINILYMAFYLVSSNPTDTELLKNSYNDVQYLFRHYTLLKNVAPGSNVAINKNMNCVVSSFINVLLSYKKAELYRCAAGLSKLLVKFLLTLDDDAMKSKNFKYTLSTLTTSLRERNLGIEALTALAAFTIKYPTFSDTVFKIWADLKAAITIGNFNKEITCYDIVTDYKEEIESEWIFFSMDKIDVGTLLLHEVLSYAKHRPLQKEPALAVYRNAAKSVEDDYLLAAILVATIECITTDGSCAYLSNFELSIQNVLERLKINEDEMILLDVKPMRDVPVLHGDQKDELDVCNITPAFSYLKAVHLEPIMMKMNLAFSYWTKATENIINNTKTVPCLSYIKSLGYLYRLFNYKAKERDTWLLLHKMGSKMSRPKYVVLAVAELLGIAEVLSINMIEDTKEILNNQENEIKTTSYTYQLFYVNLAKYYFHKGKIEETVAIIEKLDVGQIKHNFIVYTQLQILITMINSSHPHLPIDNLEATLLPMIKSFEYLQYVSKNEKWSTFNELTLQQWLLLNIGYLLGKIFADLKLVRYARSYAKNQFNMAQRLGLPLRVCELLASLGWSDMYCINTQECEIKLRGIEIILDMGTVSGADYALDTDRTEKCGSPILSNSFQCLPKFLSHNAECTCDQCMLIDYQIQALNYITLRIQLFMASQLKHQALLAIKIGVKIIDFINRKLQTPGYQGLITDLAEYKIRFYMSICGSYVLWNDIARAEEYNSLVLDELDSMLVPNIVLKCLALEQRNLLRWKRNPLVERKQPVVFVRRRAPTAPINDAKTPENTYKPPLPTIGKTPFKADATPITPCPVFRKKLILNDENVEEGDLVKSLKKVNIFDSMLPIIEIDDLSEEESKVSSEFCTPLVKKSSRVKKNLLTVPRTDENTVANNFKTPVAVRESLSSFATTDKTVKTYSRRKLNTDKKTIESTPLTTNLFSTPCLNGFKAKSSVKVYCDDKEDVSSTVRRKPRTATAKRTAKKTVDRKLNFDGEESKDSPVIIKKEKKKIGRVLFSDDSSDCEDFKMVIPVKSISNEKSEIVNGETSTKLNEKPLSQAQVIKLENNPLTDKKSEAEVIKIDSDVSIVETTPPRRTTRRKNCLTLTPRNLTDKMEKLTLTCPRETRKKKPGVLKFRE